MIIWGCVGHGWLWASLGGAGAGGLY